MASYGVFGDDATRELYGQAWSENIGWISFDRSVTGPPPTDDPISSDLDGDGISPDCSTCLAWLEPWTNQIYGWARVISACEDDLWNGTQCTGVGAGDRSGGWDGWVRLDDDGQGYNGVDRNVLVDPDELRNWAWGGDAPDSGEMSLGWISFNCDTAQPDCDPSDPSQDHAVFSDINFTPEVDDNNPPTVELDITAGPTCGTNMVLSWTYIDPEDGTNQNGYHVQVSDDGTFTDISSDIVFDSGEVGSSSQNRPVEVAWPSTRENADGAANGNGKLAFREHSDYPAAVDQPAYYWRVRVRDSAGKWSDWFEYSDNTGSPEAFATPLHPAPNTDFDWTPDPISQDETVFFNDLTTFDPTCVSNCQSWAWDMPNADGSYVNGTSSTDQNPQFVYNNYGTRTITLNATDGILESDTLLPNPDGTCVREIDESIRPPLPDYRETAPVSLFDRIKNFFARIFSFQFAKVLKLIAIK